MSGFRVDPAERLQSVVKEIQSLQNAFDRNPVFGVQFTVDKQHQDDLNEGTKAKEEENKHAIDTTFDGE